MTVMDKDRRSRMVNSSVNQPAKKGGRGGAFNWGAPADYHSEDVCAGAVRIPFAAKSNVVLAPAPQVTDQTPVSAIPEMDADSFPALSPASALSRSPEDIVWGPRDTQGDQEAPLRAHSLSKQLSADKIRSGSTELFDSQRPRNQFARKCRRSPKGAENIEPEPTIDWSASGTAAVSSALLLQSSNAAHLSLYVKSEEPRAPFSILKELSQHSSLKFVHQQPQHSKRSSMGKPVTNFQPRMILQTRGR